MCNRRETSGSNRNELMHGHARTAVLRGCPGLCCCVMLICPLLLGKSRIACVYCVGAGHGKLYIYIYWQSCLRQAQLVPQSPKPTACLRRACLLGRDHRLYRCGLRGGWSSSLLHQGFCAGIVCLYGACVHVFVVGIGIHADVPCVRSQSLRRVEALCENHL